MKTSSKITILYFGAICAAWCTICLLVSFGVIK